MRQTNIKAMVEAGVMSSLGLIAGLIGAYIPLMGFLVYFILPVPIIILGVRHGYKWSLMATVVISALIAVLIDPIRAIKIFVGFSLVSIVLGHAFRRRYKPSKIFLLGTCAALVSKIGIVILTIAISGVNPLTLETELMEKAMPQITEQVIATYRSKGIPEPNIEEVVKAMDLAWNITKTLASLFLITGAMIITYINFSVARVVLRRIGHPTEGLPPFKLWSFPRIVLYMVILGTAVDYINLPQEFAIIKTIGVNIQWGGIFLACIQGLAVFYFLADKYNLSRLVRGIILLLIITSSLYKIVIVLAGAFDIALDYRQLRRKPHSS